MVLVQELHSACTDGRLCVCWGGGGYILPKDGSVHVTLVTSNFDQSDSGCNNQSDGRCSICKLPCFLFSFIIKQMGISQVFHNKSRCFILLGIHVTCQHVTDITLKALPQNLEIYMEPIAYILCIFPRTNNCSTYKADERIHS